MPLVSVIIPVYNRAHCVNDAVESVLRQTFGDFELVVVDDGSTDETPEALRYYGPRLRVIRQDNLGVCAARNRGIEESGGDWVAFLDSDDTWLPEKLEIQTRQVAEHRSCVLHTTNAFVVDTSGGEADLFKINGFGAAPAEGALLSRPLPHQIRNGLARAQCMMVRRDALERAGRFPTDLPISLYEDQSLSCHLALQGDWLVCGRQLARICRGREDTHHLSQLRDEESVKCLESLTGVYRTLLGSPLLQPDEESLVRETLRDYEEMLAMQLLGCGRRAEARALFLRSFRGRPSVKTALKLALAAAPFGAPLAARWNRRGGGPA